MEAVDERLQKPISDLAERVKQNQGQVAFSLREFSVAGKVTGDFIPKMRFFFCSRFFVFI